MPKSVISYQKELPEIPGRCSWEKPTSFLVKDGDGWRVDESGRRKSSLLLVNKLRAEVDAWRVKEYEGAAEFMDKAPDVLRFAALGTTQQGDSASVFRVDYLKPSGAIGFYHPDWVAVQETDDGDVNWIIETKGRVWPGPSDKYGSIESWCEHISQHTHSAWRFAPVNQSDFNLRKAKTLAEITSPLSANN